MPLWGTTIHENNMAYFQDKRKKANDLTAYNCLKINLSRINLYYLKKGSDYQLIIFLALENT